MTTSRRDVIQRGIAVGVPLLLDAVPSFAQLRIAPAGEQIPVTEAQRRRAVEFFATL